jgi:bleomycin hydrolase
MCHLKNHENILILCKFASNVIKFRKMKKIVFLSALFLIFAGTIKAQQLKGLSATELSKIKSSVTKDGSFKVRQNAVTTNGIPKLAVNRENAGKLDTYFSNKVKTKGITDQKSSGRCWLFTGLNFVRPKVIEKLNLSEFEFSQNYSFFWDQLEKSNLFLEIIIATSTKPMDDKTVEWAFKNPIGDGGQWTTFADIVTKYGVVPKQVMPETEQSDNTRTISSLLTTKLREFGLEIRDMVASGKKAEALSTRKIEMLSEIYKMLSIALGTPPETFTWRFKDKDDKISDLKTYTPLSFYQEMLGIDMGEYIMFMNDPTREFNKVYEIEYDRNMADGKNWKYLNLPIDVLKKMAIASIKANSALYFSSDVGKFLLKDNGTLDVNNYNYGDLFQTKFPMTKAQRIKTFDSGSSHAMTLIGVDLDNAGNPTKWLIENSWGSTYGFNGQLIMTDQWFNEYLFRLVVHKSFVPEEIQKLLSQPAIKLPPWDPMFSPEQ